MTLQRAIRHEPRLVIRQCEEWSGGGGDPAGRLHRRFNTLSVRNVAGDFGSPDNPSGAVFDRRNTQGGLQERSVFAAPHGLEVEPQVTTCSTASKTFSQEVRMPQRFLSTRGGAPIGLGMGRNRQARDLGAARQFRHHRLNRAHGNSGARFDEKHRCARSQRVPPAQISMHGRGGPWCLAGPRVLLAPLPWSRTSPLRSCSAWPRLVGGCIEGASGSWSI